MKTRDPMDPHALLPLPTLESEGGFLGAVAVERQVNALAAILTIQGVRRGVVVGVRASTSAPLVLVMFALWRLGAVIAPVNPREPEAVSAARHRLVGARVILHGELPNRIDRFDANVVHLRLGDVLQAAGAKVETRPHICVGDWARDATYIFTSGSSGRPKAVLHTLAAHVASAVGSNRNLPLARGDRWLLALPLFHVGGLGILFRCALAGATVVLPSLVSVGDGVTLAAAITAERISHISLVPTQLLRLLAAPDTEWQRHVRAVLLGGAPIPADLAQAAARRSVPLFTTYGSTEMASQITTTAPGDPLHAWHTAGRPLAGRDVRIGADDEILVRGTTLGRGYLMAATNTLVGEVMAGGNEDRGGPEQPTTTLQPLTDADGWFHTRDRGRLDEAGRLIVLGRLDNQFISGGENIQPEVIETALLALPGVRQACVVPLADPEYGMRPVAFVDVDAAALPFGVLAPTPGDTAAVATTWWQALEGGLPGFMRPLAVHPWPTDVAGLKPDRAQFARLAAALA